MSPPPSFERAFVAALLAPGRAPPPTLIAGGKPASRRRFDIYRNNVFAGLIKVLAGRFPVVRQLVGEDFFRAAARIFIERDPPRSPILLLWGESFADFLQGFEPARELAYLADVARLEWARHAACHAADAPALDARHLAAIDPQAIGGMRLGLHPSLRLVRSPYPVVSIWERHQTQDRMAPLALTQAESALVVRPHLQVLVHRIGPSTAAFVAGLQSGQTLAQAVEGAGEDFDPAINLAGLIRIGAIASVELPAPAASTREARPS